MAITQTQAEDAVRAHGGISAAARALGVPRSTLRGRLDGKPPSAVRGAGSPARLSGPRLSRAGLMDALRPPNLCRVKAFLDALDASDRTLVEEAMAYPSNPMLGGMSHKALRQWLIEDGEFPAHEVPTEGQIENHRAGKGGCKCRD